MSTAPELVGSFITPTGKDRLVKLRFLSITDRMRTTLAIVSFDRFREFWFWLL